MKSEGIPQIDKIAGDEEFKTAFSNGEYFENYLISNYGRVYSLNCKRILSKKIDSHGYVRYKLFKDGKEKYISGQRLVAFGFVKNPKPEKYNTVNHLDEDTQNNKWTNLEWCDDKWNLNWASCQKRRSAQRAKKVLQFDLNNNIVAEFESLPKAAKAIDCSITPIWRRCNCLDKTQYKNYYWRYADAINKRKRIE